MRLLNLNVTDLGLFRGRHDFDLTPVRNPDGGHRNLIVIRGRNGVGKSTLFQALALALHGSLSLGPRASRDEYNHFLLKKIHRAKPGGSQMANESASVALSFEYVLSGRPLRVQVERRFELNGMSVAEKLRVLCDGNPPDVDAADYQTWINDLVPPRIADLCFFDAEHLDAISDKERSTASLAYALNRLLGLDLIERLRSDLEQYTFTRGGGSRALSRQRAKVIEYQTTVDSLIAQIKELTQSSEELKSQRIALEVELAEQERRLAAEGGAYAMRRPVQQQRLTALREEIGELETQLRDMSNELLPFALAPLLCRSLSDRLKLESSVRTQAAVEGLWREATAGLTTMLKSPEFYRGLSVPVKDRKDLAARVLRALRKSRPQHSATRLSAVHNLSESESELIQSWITRATEIVPHQVKFVATRLRALQMERRRTESDVKRAPDDAALAPLHSEITRLQVALEEVRRRESALSEEMGAFQFKCADATRQRQRAADELHKSQMNQKQLSLAERSIASLRAYKNEITHHRLAELEDAIVSSFNTLCRKEHLLEAVRISPIDFGLELRGGEGRLLSLGEFSAGERQLYGLALLWALRRVSAKQLPLAIDAPLARLDEVHRSRLIYEYVPAVSDQVILFATDFEADEDLITAAHSLIARSYELHYQVGDEQTQVSCRDLREEPASSGDKQSTVVTQAKGSAAFDA